MIEPIDITIYRETLNKKDDTMVSRIRKTLTVQQRMAAFEHTNKVAMEAADEERRNREEKTERLRRLRLSTTGEGRKR
ncbi:hypothetical protein [Rhizobium leucaenae]|uniref:Tfp pilus assembly protein PilX n=1 Tax=Rhizobium leucaenae TaxID=29450 RepID=A0A7W6ZW83_9HYPH|nr:hypothetical protein [Rhizobium leucaenae]MBB4569335.1 Tfp pilus assembly protein PilX [Rhizobium leucaenae]MBB6302787.1 Tfp pilus assembly protein PilX [Rhizobium leucaenae]